MSTVRRRALISVFHKDGILDLARRLAAAGFEIVSTGGTARHLSQAGITVTPLDEVTGFPEMMDGRVKTLHPKVHGAILFRRDLSSHAEEADRHGIVPIDLVAVNLYPFVETAARPGATDGEVVEMIDIGGPSMLRAAAKNHDAVTVLVDPIDYEPVLEEIEHDGTTSPSTRRRLAAHAFRYCSEYDQAVAAHLASTTPAASGSASDITAAEEQVFPALLAPTFRRAGRLRYGENPHQRAFLYHDPSPATGSVVAAAVLQGKELSFNNYLDLDAAWALAGEFEPPAAVVVKHNNPCGVALGDSLHEAYQAARDADATSAFGGIVAVNRVMDRQTAEEIASTFIEAVFAPGYDEQAREVLARKKNLRLLDSGGMAPGSGRPALDLRRLSGGLLAQDADHEPEPRDWRVVTKRQPSAAERAALEFAWKVAGHVRSNAIVYATVGRTLGIGAGQMSRIDAARIGAHKAGERLQGAVLASDAFFPFRDSVDQAADVGVTAIVEPGGSKRDAEVIAAADEAGMAMLLTGVRHFRH